MKRIFRYGLLGITAISWILFIYTGSLLRAEEKNEKVNGYFGEMYGPASYFYTPLLVASIGLSIVLAGYLVLQRNKLQPVAGGDATR